MNAVRIALVLTLAAAACDTTPLVETDVDPRADFSRYHTYRWADQAAPPAGMDELTYERTRDSIDRQLAAQGYRRGDPADFSVSFTLGARDRIEIDDFGPYAPYYPGPQYGYTWGAAAEDRYRVRNVSEGSLIIDFYDVQTNEPLWRGVVSKEVNPTGTPDQGVIDQGVAAALAEFPPTPS